MRKLLMLCIFGGLALAQDKDLQKRLSEAEKKADFKTIIAADAQMQSIAAQLQAQFEKATSAIQAEKTEAIKRRCEAEQIPVPLCEIDPSGGKVTKKIEKAEAKPPGGSK